MHLLPAVSAPFRVPVRPRRVGSGFRPSERRSIGAMAAFVLLLHVVGWGVLVLAVAPAEY